MKTTAGMTRLLAYQRGAVELVNQPKWDPRKLEFNFTKRDFDLRERDARKPVRLPLYGNK